MNKKLLLLLGAGAAGLFLYNRSKANKTGLGSFVSYKSLAKAALPLMGLKNPILSTLLNEGIEGFFKKKKEDENVIDAEYKVIS